jgi:CHAD domain-containing protein
VSDLLPPEEMTFAAVGEALHAELTVRDGTEVVRDLAFYDSFDGLLHAAGLALIYQRGELVLIGLQDGERRAAGKRDKPTPPLTAVQLQPAPLRDAVAAVTELRALLPLVEVHSTARGLDVLDGNQKTVVRITVEEPALVSSSGRLTMLRPRVHLAAVRGYGEELRRVTRTLQRQLQFKPAAEPLLDEAVRASGGAPGGTSSKIHVPLRPGQRADSAAVAVLKRLLEVIEANLEGTIADVDSEFLHDFRVAVRRSRAVQRELKGVFPPREHAHFRDEFRWLQEITGDARDLDVYVLEFEDYRKMAPATMRADLDPLLVVLRGRRLVARRDMVRALRSERATTVRAQWAAFLDRLEDLPDEDRPAAGRHIGRHSGERIAKVYKRMLHMGNAIGQSSPPTAYHELRKQGKELRYLLELFGAPLYPADVVKPMIRALKSLQDVLGRHQDREVQVATLRSLRDEVSALPGGAGALMAMGVLVEGLAEDEQSARRSFSTRFGEFASKDQRALVRQTFT